MGGAPLLLAIAAVTVDYGYQPDGRGGVEYIVQVTQEEFEHVRQAGEFSSVIDPEVRGRVSRILIRVGNAKLPRDAGPPPTDDSSIAGARPWDANADHAFVPPPEMVDQAIGDGDHDGQASIRLSKPQDSPSLALPNTDPQVRGALDDASARLREGLDRGGQGLRNAAEAGIAAAQGTADGLADPLRRLGGASTDASTTPARQMNVSGVGGNQVSSGNGGSSTAANPRALGDPQRDGFVSDSPAASTPTTGLPQGQRPNNWRSEPSANLSMPSTAPREVGATAAAGNFGAPPAGINDPRMQSNNNQFSGSGNADRLGSSAAPTPQQNIGFNPATTSPQQNMQPSPQQFQGQAFENYGSQQTSNQQGQNWMGASPGNQFAATNSGPMPQNTQVGMNAAGQGPAIGQSQGIGMQAGPNYGNGNFVGQYPGGGGAGSPAGPVNAPAPWQLAPESTRAAPFPLRREADLRSASSTFDPVASTSLLADRSRGSLATRTTQETIRATANSRWADDENQALPQQVFNAMLLLSLVANAYLIIHMSKLIQRYRDLRVSLRSATANTNAPKAATI